MTEDYMITSGVLVSMKHMKTTGNLRVEIEIEKERANQAFVALGQFPDPATARHVAITVLKND